MARVRNTVSNRVRCDHESIDRLQHRSIANALDPAARSDARGVPDRGVACLEKVLRLVVGNGSSLGGLGERNVLCACMCVRV